MPRTRFGGAIPANQIVAHFWSKVDLDGPVIRPELGPCWLWTDYRKENGYGQFYINRRPVYAHRFVCEMKYGPLKAGEWVRHHCDNGAGGCVRPDHIEPGTPAQNAQDRVDRNRVPKGERHYTRRRLRESSNLETGGHCAG